MCKFCVHIRIFAYVCVRMLVYVCVKFCATYAASRRLYVFCVRLCTALRNVAFAYVYVRLLRVKRLVRTYTAFEC